MSTAPATAPVLHASKGRAQSRSGIKIDVHSHIEIAEAASLELVLGLSAEEKEKIAGKNPAALFRVNV